MSFIRAIRSFVFRDDGSIAVMSAVSAACVIGCAGLAIDLGQLFLERRHLQNMADLAALAAVGNLANPAANARAVLTANNVQANLSVETGTYDRGAALGERYSSGGAQPNAVAVTLEQPGELYFIRAVYRGALPVIRVRATASDTKSAQFSIGSRLLSLNEGVINQLLGGLLGTTVNLAVMDYSGLVVANIDLLQFMDALAGEVGVTAGTYDSVLDAEVTVADVVSAAATVADRSGQNAARVALNKLLGSPGIGNVVLKGGRLLDLGPIGDLGLGETPAGLRTNVNAFDLVRATAQAAGQHQVAVNLGASVPGLLGLSAYLSVGEPPQGTSWVTVGQEGAKVYTAQTRVRLDVIVAQVLGGRGVLRVPLFIDIAAGEAELTRISCGANPVTDASVRLTARPSLAKLWIGEPSNLSAWNGMQPVTMNKASLVDVPLVASVYGKSKAEATNKQSKPLDFSARQIAEKTPQTVNTQDTLSTLLPTLFGNLELELKNGLLGGILNPLTPLVSGLLGVVSTLLAPVAGILDPVVHGLLDLLGVHIGEADLRVHGVRCGVPVLVM